MTFQLVSVEATSPEKIAGVLENFKKKALRVEKDETPRIRATLSNLILLCSSEEEKRSGHEVDELLNSLSKYHPSRFFVVEYSDKYVEALKCGVRVREFVGANGVPMQTEEISLFVNSDGAGVVKNLILSHLVPDIETVLVVPYAEKTQSGPLQIASEIMTIVDSCIINSPQGLNNNSEKYLSWARTDKWRSIITEQFDSVFSCSALDKLERISIISEGQLWSSEVIFMLAWILDSLSLTEELVREVDESGNLKLTFADKKIESPCIELKKGAGSGYAGLSKVGFYMKGEHGQDYVVESSYNDQKNCIEVATFGDHNSSEDAETCEFYIRSLNCENLNESELLVNLIRRSIKTSPVETYLRLRPLIS